MGRRFLGRVQRLRLPRMIATVPAKTIRAELAAVHSISGTGCGGRGAIGIGVSCAPAIDAPAQMRSSASNADFLIFLPSLLSPSIDTLAKAPRACKRSALATDSVTLSLRMARYRRGAMDRPPVNQTIWAWPLPGSNADISLTLDSTASCVRFRRQDNSLSPCSPYITQRSTISRAFPSPRPSPNRQSVP